MDVLSVAALMALAGWWWTTPAMGSRAGSRGGSLWWRRRSRRPERSSRSGHAADLAEVCDLLALALAGGAPLERAMTGVAAVVGAERGQQLRAVAAALAWGVPEDQAWQVVGPEWERPRAALELARRAGIAPGELLLTAAREHRRERLAAVEVSAAKLPVRLLVPLGLIFLPAFMLTTVVPVVLALAREVLAFA